MADNNNRNPEIESFNLADLDVSALDTRLELTTMVPQYIICPGNCPSNCGINCTVDCSYNTGCTCHSYS
jgi:hypothetical protein